MTIVVANDGYSGKRRDGTVKEAEFVVALNADGTPIGAAAGTSGPMKLEDDGHVSGDAGVFVLAVRRDNAGSSVGANFDYTALVTDAYSNLFIAGGISTARLVSAAGSTNATSAKAAAGRVYKIFATSKSASTRYLKLYNKASAPTVGTDTPIQTIEIPPLTTIALDLDGCVFSTGIAYAITAGTGADADTNAVTAGDITSLTIWYS